MKDVKKITGVSIFASHKILNFLLGRENLIVPSIFFLALSTAPLGNDGIGAIEPTDPAYARLPLPNNKTTFSLATNKQVQIAREFIFPTSTVSWERCTHYLIYDNNVGGNVWFYGELKNSIHVEAESTPLLDAGANNFTLDICGGSSVEMALTTGAANVILDHLFGRSPVLVPPENFFLGVSSTQISPEGIGFTEPTHGNYNRLQLPNNKNTFTFADNKSITLAREFRFPNSTAPWGNMTHFFIADAPNGGNVWWSGGLIHSRNVELSTTLAILPSGFRWILDSCHSAIVSASTPNAMAARFWG